MAKFTWDILRRDEDIDAAIALSHQQAVVIFKHSTRCPVSSMALRMFERDWSFDTERIRPYFLDLIAHRQLSNRIAQELAVEHQSPQMIVIRNGMAVFDASHNQVQASAIDAHL